MMQRTPMLTSLLAAAFVVGCAADSDSAADSAAVATTPAATAAPAVPAPALDDATIVAIFDAANQADIETGSLAAEKGESQAVRDFGAQLARDHAAVQQQGRDLAARLGVTPTPPANDPSAAAHQAAMDSLRTLSGAAFDRAFLAHEVQFHQGVIDAVNSTLLPAITNDEVRALVVQVAPAFEAHRAKAQSLLDGMGS